MRLLRSICFILGRMGALFFALSGCHHRQQNHACLFLDDNPSMNQAILNTSSSPQRQALLLAVIQHESGYKANARPVKQWLIRGWIPWSYYSSAQGYAQSTSPTWSDFSKQTRGHPKRQSYVDNVRFVDWYFTKHGHHLQDIRDYYEAYFLYHDGPHGYHTKKYKRSYQLHVFASRVAKDALRYAKQLADCQASLQWQYQWQSF